MWQNNERKARFIAAALSGDRSIRRLEDIGSQADQFALAKAIASGDGRLMQKAGLESEMARLLRQRAAHIDDQHNIRRQIQTAQADQQWAKARMTAIQQDLARRISTRGDAFTMAIQGRSLTDRKTAGASLLSNIRLAHLERATRDWTIGQIGGFELTCSTWRKLTSQRGAAELVLQRTDYAHAIEVTDEQTALGLIARLEYVLDHFESDLADQTHRLADATARLAGYAPRLGESFPLQGELDEKLARLAELDADLAQTKSVTAADEPDLPASTTDLA